MTLDSLGNGHSDVTRNLKDYLQAESVEKRGKRIIEPKGLTAAGLPLQQNFADCGVYMIAYLERFLKSPEGFVDSALAKKESYWPLSFSAGRIRDQCFEKVLREHAKQHGGTLPSSFTSSDRHQEKPSLIGLDRGMRSGGTEARKRAAAPEVRPKLRHGPSSRQEPPVTASVHQVQDDVPIARENDDRQEAQARSRERKVDAEAQAVETPDERCHEVAHPLDSEDELRVDEVKSTPRFQSPTKQGSRVRARSPASSKLSGRALEQTSLSLAKACREASVDLGELETATVKSVSWARAGQPSSDADMLEESEVDAQRVQQDIRDAAHTEDRPHRSRVLLEIQESKLLSDSDSSVEEEAAKRSSSPRLSMQGSPRFPQYPPYHPTKTERSPYF